MYKKLLTAFSLFSLLYSISAVESNQSVSTADLKKKTNTSVEYCCKSNDLLEQINAILKWLPINKDKPTAIVLGTSANEKDLGSRFGNTKNYIFSDIEESKHDNIPFLKLDFNSIPQLKILAEHLSEKIDDIYMDNSVFKYTNWTEEHIQLLAASLKDGGSMLIPFAPYINIETEIMITDTSEEFTLLSDIKSSTPEDAPKIRAKVASFIAKFDNEKFKEKGYSPLSGVVYKLHDSVLGTLLGRIVNGPRLSSEMIDLLLEKGIYDSEEAFKEETYEILEKAAANRFVGCVNEIEGLSAKVASGRKLPFEPNWGDNSNLIVITKNPKKI
jgi:hypothetical protein